MKKQILTIFLIICITSIFNTSIIFAEDQPNVESSNVKQDSDYIKQLSRQGVLLQNEGKSEEAIVIFDKILEIDPNNAIALSNKGSALVSLGEYERALENFDYALKIEPENTEIMNNKAATLAKLNKFDEAIIVLNQILAIDSDDIDAQIAKKIITESFKKKQKVEIHTETEFLPTPIKNTKYLALVQSQVRNSQGVLISTGETDRVFVVPHSITDEYLDSFPVVAKVVTNGKTYEKFSILFIAEVMEDRFTGQTFLISETDESVVLFSALTPGYTIEKGDKVEHIWTIFRLIS